MLHQEYLALVDHVHEQIASNAVTMLHQVVDSEGANVDDTKENFHHCCKDEDDIVANVDTHDEFRFFLGLL